MELCGNSFLAHAPFACRRIVRLFPFDPTLAVEQAESSLAKVRWHDELSVVEWLVASPANAVIALSLLSDRPNSLPGERLAQLLPELSGLAVPKTATSHEHDKGEVIGDARTPLLDHVLRSLLYLNDSKAPLDGAWRQLATAVLLFGDVAKGGDAAIRGKWQREYGLEGAVHNEESSVILSDVGRRLLSKVDPFKHDARWLERAIALCASTGLVGMRIRGEVERDALAAMREELLKESDGGQLLLRVFSEINRCDTSAVRAGLWTDALAARFSEEEKAIGSYDPSAISQITPFDERLVRLRKGAIFSEEDLTDAGNALRQMGHWGNVVAERFRYCRFWYAEAALGVLGWESSVRLLVLLSSIGAQKAKIDEPWHLDLLKLGQLLRRESGEAELYRVRLLETLVSRTSVEELLAGHLSGAVGGESAFVTLSTNRRGHSAIVVGLEEGDEAKALLSLLPIYEKKKAAAFHTTLKTLCDLYGLRKDDFDRVANEANYLSTMNAAMNDKARMLEYVKPGCIVEVGPGGGVVLSLLRKRFEQGRVIGLDASAAVVEALRAKYQEQDRIEIVHGDAFDLPSIVGERSASTVVFCSVLHEIFSYVEWKKQDGSGTSRFEFAAVAAITQSAFKALEPGGRIVVRDGIMPEKGQIVLEFLDQAWREGLDTFASVYEARKIAIEVLSASRVRMSRADVYEFLTTFTWGLSAFPYEIREQRGVLPREEYVRRMIEACDGLEPGYEAREVEVVKDLSSYLQPGYPQNILPHLRIFDESGMTEIPMPDINGVWVLEKVNAI